VVQVVDQGACVPGFDNNFIDVSLGKVVTYLATEALLDSALTGGQSVFQSKGHGGVIICTKRSYERSFDLVVFFERDLVITRVTVEKRKEFASGC